MSKKLQEFKAASEVFQLTIINVLIVYMLVLSFVVCCLGFVSGGFTGLGIALFSVAVLHFLAVKYIRLHSIPVFVPQSRVGR